MAFLTSNLMIKILVGAAFVVACIAVSNISSGESACSRVSYYPNRSIVYDCPAGFNVASLKNPYKINVYTTVTTSVKARAWLAKSGDTETPKTIEKNLGAPGVVGPGAFMAVAEGEGLVYVESPKRFLMTVVWDVPSHL